MIRITLSSEVKEVRVCYYINDLDWATTKRAFDRAFARDNTFRIFDDTFDNTFE